MLQSLVIVSILSGGVALICRGFSDFIVNLFFGEAYIEAGALTGFYAAAMFLFSLAVVLIHYSLAIRNLWLMLLAASATLAEVAPS